MLAIKLHKKNKPFLGEGSYLVPLFHWKSGDPLIRSWTKTLNQSNRGMPNDKVRFMTLVRIPDSLPVCLHFDWIDGEISFLPWKDHPAENLEVQRDQRRWKPSPSWFSRINQSYPAGNGLVWMFDEARQRVVRVQDPKKRKQLCVRWPGYSDKTEEDSTFTIRGKKHYFKGENLWMPEIILGAPLDKSAILWTKDIRLLQTGNQRSKEVDRRTKRECRFHGE